MADLSITAASVANLSGKGSQTNGVAAGTITAGMPVYQNATNGIVAAANTSALLADAVGIALNAASTGQPVTYQTRGNINLGATLAIGKVYVLSAAGLISPVDDVATADFVTVLGVGVTASNMKLGIVAAGVAAAGDVT
jgi:hypothetical protein